jgi:DNA-binding CsgD family transcriptional regulator
MLVGRDAERAEIEALLEDARRGRSRVLVFTGEAGIGKTALLDYARERAAGMQVLAVAGVESEANLPFGALHALLRPVLDSLADLPDRQRIALSAALALEASEEPDRLATYAGTLTLLDDVASERALLVVLDDAHWIDRESAEAVAFVCRRMAGVDLAIVAAVRDGEPSSFDHSSLPTRVVGPLTEQQSLELLELRHREAIGSGAAQAVAAISVGNPLALIELPTTLSADQLAGREPLEEPLPVAMRIEQAFLRRAERLPADTWRSLLVAAAAADSPITAIREAAAAVGGGSLGPAESEGLLRIEHDRVHFAHPLLRSAVYQAGERVLRRRVHEALAAALVDEPDQRAWQLAAAAEGPDEATATALEAAADRAVKRGGHAARARALERAADLSPDPAERARRMCAAAQAAFWAGDSPHAIALCERALPLVDDPLVRADLVHQLWAVAGWQKGAFDMPDLETEASRVEDLDADRACKLLIPLLNRCWGTLDYSGVLTTSSRIERLVDRMGPWWRPRALATLAEARVATGDIAPAHELYDELVAMDLIAAAAYVQALVWVERYDDARRALAASLELGRRDGNVLRVAWSQGGSAILEVALGRFASARALASDALELARALDLGFLVALNLVTLATIDALQGRDAACHDRVTEALARAPEDGNDDLRLSARLSLGLLESSRGRYDEALSELEPIHERVMRSGLAEPSLFPYQPDLVEAYARLGRPEEANTMLDYFVRQAEAVGRRWALAAAARCRGLLAEPADIDAAFGVAFALHEDVPSPFERARTQLVYGERLRRANRRRDARPHLRAALEVFDELGARPWHERAAADLRATGEHVPRREPDDREQLTPQELQIATLVAEGMTNREIGAQIFLSPKTVEYHLTRVYRKLDLHSRAELIREFAAESRELETTSPDRR